MSTDVIMWEVRAAPGRLFDLLAWVGATADPSAQIFTSEGDEARIVVIAEIIDMLADPPADLIARPAHSWPFRRVRG